MWNHAPKNGDGEGIEGDRSRTFLISAFVMVVTVAVYVSAIVLMTKGMKERLYEGILQQDGKLFQAATAASDQSGQNENDSAQEQLLALLEASNLNTNIFALRRFDANGKYVIGFPQEILPFDLPAADVDLLRKGEPIGRFEAKADITKDFLPGRTDKPTEAAPVMRAMVPIRSSRGIIGFAEFSMYHPDAERQLHQIDREVRQSALWFSIAGSVVIIVALALAFSRLNKANALLAKRTATLLHANHELALAAKTSAIGAVAAHLIHGLKNPLFGLQAFVTSRAEDLQSEGGDWKIAADAAQRMQAMIADIVRILREDADDRYEISIAEVTQILEGKVKPLAREAEIRLIVESTASGKMANREANLLILCLTNLVQNAVQASGPGKKVRLLIYPKNETICFDVIDEAGGIPAAMRPLLFTPIQSTKPGGTGLGLAITKQLANHMGGQLELAETNEQGTTFRLSIPGDSLLLVAGSKGKLEPNAVA